MDLEAKTPMFLIYADGSKTEAFLLSRTDDTIRVAVPGSDDPLELTKISGTWVSEDCEPVRVEFAWQGKTREEMLDEADCVCSKDLAAHLLHLLWSGDEDSPKVNEMARAAEVAAPVWIEN
ncbi:MAG TPA: hypothetical protein VHZ25_04230 [Acidobacteriaceae bacterium]|jgi:hypothetical protein|nr:hypothetical protein [Acidobacteriaceae bacterium]